MQFFKTPKLKQISLKVVNQPAEKAKSRSRFAPALFNQLTLTLTLHSHSTISLYTQLPFPT